MATTPVRLAEAGDGFLQQFDLGPVLSRFAVDQVGAEERAAALAKRSIKKESKVAALRLAVSVMDLTTLEGSDTPGKVQALCAKARRPDPADPTVPPVGAVCVYPTLVATAKRELAGSSVKVASVATAFPSGQAPLDLRLREVGEAVEAGADEIDMVINRGAFLSGRYREVFEEIAATRDACGTARLKVILETGELGSYDNVRRGRAHGQAGDPVPGGGGRDAGPRLAHAGVAADRRLQPPERLPDAARQGAHRPVPVGGLLHQGLGGVDPCSGTSSTCVNTTPPGSPTISLSGPASPSERSITRARGPSSRRWGTTVTLPSVTDTVILSNTSCSRAFRIGVVAASSTPTMIRLAAVSRSSNASSSATGNDCSTVDSRSRRRSLAFSACSLRCSYSSSRRE